jgi:hypothetical protein
MKSNLRTAIVLGIAISGFAVQLTCQTQSPTSSPDKKPAQETTADAATVETALVEFPAMEGPENGPAASANDAGRCTAPRAEPQSQRSSS